MALTTDNIADLAKTTLRELGKDRWSDLSGDLQNYQVMPRLLKKNKHEVKSGYELQWQLMVDDNGAANRPGLFPVDNYNYADVIIQGTIPWRHANTFWAIDSRLIQMNTGASQVVNMVKVQRTAAWISLAKQLETDFWGKPTDSTDTTKPYGVDMWVTKSATTGFQGGNPSGFTSGVGGISSVTYSRWRNWTYQYTAISTTDLIRGWREAATKTHFEAPIDVPEYVKSSNSDYAYYTNWDVAGRLEELIEDQNENLGNDLDSKHGVVMFRRNPVVYTSELDSDSQDPIYGINWKSLMPVCLSGWYLKESPPEKAPTSHVTIKSDIDLTYQYMAYDRRKLFILNIA